MIARTEGRNPSSNTAPRFRVSPDAEAAAEMNTQHQLVTSVGNWIGEHPVLSVGVALSLGVALGCLVKRR
jgi:ElaB/YqjD/DUF883 family membrane-anchored ribosome-binding protein